jgi:hypothetical protein
MHIFDIVIVLIGYHALGLESCGSPREVKLLSRFSDISGGCGLLGIVGFSLTNTSSRRYALGNHDFLRDGPVFDLRSPPHV